MLTLVNRQPKITQQPGWRCAAMSLRVWTIPYGGSYIFCRYYVMKVHQINRLCFKVQNNPNNIKNIFEIFALFRFFLSIFFKNTQQWQQSAWTTPISEKITFILILPPKLPKIVLTSVLTWRSFEPTFEEIEAHFFQKFFHVTLKN